MPRFVVSTVLFSRLVDAPMPDKRCEALEQGWCRLTCCLTGSTQSLTWIPHPHSSITPQSLFVAVRLQHAFVGQQHFPPARNSSDADDLSGSVLFYSAHRLGTPERPQAAGIRRRILKFPTLPVCAGTAPSKCAPCKILIAVTLAHKQERTSDGGCVCECSVF